MLNASLQLTNTVQLVEGVNRRFGSYVGNTSHKCEAIATRLLVWVLSGFDEPEGKPGYMFRKVCLLQSSSLAVLEAPGAKKIFGSLLALAHKFLPFMIFGLKPELGHVL